MNLLGRLRAGLRRTAEQLAGRLDDLVRAETEGAQRSGPAADTLDALEELLIEADVGVAATDRIVASVRDREGRNGGGELKELIKREILRILDGSRESPPDGTRPRVVLVVGVNGTGKTTTVGKLAHRCRSEGATPLILRRRHVPRRRWGTNRDVGQTSHRRHRTGPVRCRPGRRRLRRHSGGSRPRA